MSQSGYTPIQLYRTSTAAAVPTAGNLAAGELAINLTDEALYFKNAAGVVTLLADSSGALGSVTSVAVSGGTTGLTTSGGPITSSGTITLAGTLAVANGGTGVTTSTGTTNVVLSNSPTLVTPTLGAASATSIANALGAVGTPSYTFTGDLNTGMWSPAADTIAFSEGGVEAMRIDSSGNVGIGTSSPGAKLDVRSANIADGTNGGVINAYSTTAQAANIGGKIDLGGLYDGSNSLSFASVAGRKENSTSGDWSGYMQFSTRRFGADFVERMRINSSGNVGIGSASPEAKLQVRQDLDGTTGIIIQNRLNSGTPIAALRFITGSLDLSDDRYASIASGGTAAADLRFITSSGGPAERMRIDGSGNVGIGTTTPAGKLHTQLATSFAWGGNWNNGVAAGGGAGAANGAIAVSYNDTDGGTIGAIVPGVNWKAVRIFSDNIQFCTNGATERARIDSSGNFMVGTTAYSATLAQGAAISGNSATAMFIGHANGTASGATYVGFVYNSTAIGSITQNGTTGVLFNITSDVRLKKNIADADDAASLIDAIQVRKFDWKSDGSHQRYGFIAQELVTVAPEVVHNPADPDEMMAVDYSKLVPMLVKEIQSLRARVAQLEGN